MEFNKHTNARADLIHGIWYAEFAQIAGADFILQREPFFPTGSTSGHEDSVKGYLQRFEFYEKGEFVDAYAAPCGNDGRIHHWTGNWKVSEDGQILILQIENYPTREYRNLKPSESYKKGQELQIIEIAKEEIKLKFKDPGGDPRAASPLWEYDRNNV